MMAPFLEHFASLVLALLRTSFVLTRSTAGAGLCVPSEPYVDCNFHALSSPHWAALSGDTAALTAAWKAAVAQTPEYPSGRFAGQGLVITATKLDLVNVPVLLSMLELEGFTLPVEVRCWLASYVLFWTESGFYSAVCTRPARKEALQSLFLNVKTVVHSSES